MRWPRITLFWLLITLVAWLAVPVVAHENTNPHGNHSTSRYYSGCNYVALHYQGGYSYWYATAYTGNNGGCDTVGAKPYARTALHQAYCNCHAWSSDSWRYSSSYVYNTWSGPPYAMAWYLYKSGHKAESSSTGRWVTYYMTW